MTVLNFSSYFFSLIHHCKSTVQRPQQPNVGKCQKCQKNQLFHQHPASHVTSKEAYVTAPHDIPYVDQTPEQCPSTTTTVDNGLKTIPQISAARDSSAPTSIGTTQCTNVETTAPTTILSPGDVSISPCQMAHVVQPSSPCVTVKRRNIFSCCSRKRGQQRRRVSGSMSMQATGCCSGQHVVSGKNCYNQKVMIM